MPVVGYQITTAEYSPEENLYTLSFHFSNPDPLDSGYEVMAKLPDNSEVILDRFVNRQNLDVTVNEEKPVVTSSGIIYITSRFSGALIPFGNLVRIFLRVYRSDNSYTYDTLNARFRTPVSQILDFQVVYDSRDLIFTWEQKLDEDVESFVIERSKGALIGQFEIQNQIYTGITFSSPEFVFGESYVVHDLYNDYFWYPVLCTQDSRISISAETLKNTILFVDYQRTETINYNIYKFSEPFQEYASVDGNFFNGQLNVLYPGDDFFYRYRVKGTGGDIEVYSPVQYNRPLILENKIPRLYPIYESNDSDYGNALFFTMRNCLVDENIYKKNQYSLPLKDFDDAIYNFRGFLGTAYCPVEVYMDGVIFTTVRSDANGEFSVDFNPPKSSFTMSLVAYNRDSTKTFVPVYDLPFDKLLIYTYFAGITKQLSELSDVGYTFNVARHIITEADENTIKDFYSKAINMVFNYDDTYEKYRQEVLFLYPLLWNNPAVLSVEVVTQILEYYRDNDYGIKDFVIHRNGDPFSAGNDLLKLNSSVMTSLKTQLGSNKYEYYVTSQDISNPILESYPQRIMADYRVYSTTATINFPAIAFVWNPIKPKGQASYNVYRRINDGPVKWIKNTLATGYIDNGLAVESDRVFPTFQYTNIEMVSNLRFYTRTALQNINYGDYTSNFLMITLYGTGTDSIPFGIRDRLTTLLSQKTSPSQRITLKFI